MTVHIRISKADHSSRLMHLGLIMEELAIMHAPSPHPFRCRETLRRAPKSPLVYRGFLGQADPWVAQDELMDKSCNDVAGRFR